MSHAYMCAQKDIQTYETSYAHKRHSEPVRKKSPSLPPGKSEDFCNMKSAGFQTLGTNKKVIIVHPQTRYWSPGERTLKLFLNFFLQEKIQTQETGRPFVPVPFFVFLRGRFCIFFWFNRTSKIGAVEGVTRSP
jgi:hypothetical protein